MIRSIMKWMLIAIIAVTLWKFFNGDLGAILSAVWTFAAGIVTQVSDWLLSTSIVSSIFGATT